MSARVALIDGNGLAYRAFFAMPGDLRTADGTLTGAVYGFAQMFRKLIGGRTPTLGAVVFDGAGNKASRTALDPSYKSARLAFPPQLAPQMPWIERLIRAHNYPILRVPGVEADDVIATLCRQAVEAGHEVYIVSGDKDFAQLVSDRVRLFDATKEVTYDADLVRRKWGVLPASFPDFLALAGDPSDQIPGAPGIGPKTACKLLAEHGSVDGLYAALDQLPARTASILREHEAQVRTSRKLAVVDQHTPLDVHVSELTVPPTDPGELNALYRELEFYSLLSAEEVADVGEDTGEWAIADTPELARAALAGECTGDFVVGVHVLQELSHEGLPGFPHLVGELTGIALSPRPGRAVYFPLDGVPLDVLAPWLEDERQPKAFHEVKLAMVPLAAAGVGLQGVVGDSALASYLVDPTKHQPHRLEQVAREYLRTAIQPLKGVVGSAKTFVRFRDLPPGRAGAYACHLADTVRGAWEVLEPRLHADEMWSLYEDLDLPLSATLARMELAGIRVDPLRLVRLDAELNAEKDAIAREIHEIAGREFHVGSLKQLGTVLFDEMKLPIIKRTKTGYATDSETLEKLADRSPIIPKILRFRSISKLIDAYTQVLLRSVDPRDGRIHATFNQTVAASGRLITGEPDLQRTPVRTGEYRQIREAFVASPGHKLVSGDWSQIELRVMAHLARDYRLISAFTEGRDVHRETAAELFGVPAADVTGEQRSIGKTVNFATIYGQGATSLGTKLGIPRPKAKEYIDRFFEHYEGVARWKESTITEAYLDGFVTTMWKRRRYIPELKSHNFTDRAYGERIATNAPIQGTAADLCKAAMLRIDEALLDRGLQARLVLQIHDELVLEVPDEEVDAVVPLVREHMEKVADLAVPLAVEVGVGRTWADAH